MLPSGEKPRTCRVTPLFFSPVSNPLSQENGADAANSNGRSLDIVAGHRLRRTPRTPLLPTLNPQVSGSNPEGRTFSTGTPSSMAISGISMLFHYSAYALPAPMMKSSASLNETPSPLQRHRVIGRSTRGCRQRAVSVLRRMFVAERLHEALGLMEFAQVPLFSRRLTAVCCGRHGGNPCRRSP
jgi:hypothetical protein